MRARLLILLVLCFLSDLSDPFAPGTFEFDSEHRVQGLRQSRPQPLAPLAVPAEPVPMNEFAPQSKVARPRLPIAPIPRLTSLPRRTLLPHADVQSDADGG